MEWIPDIVIYHDKCADGFGAAWAAYRKWGDLPEYLAYSYNQTPPDVTDKKVLIVDFSFKPDILLSMANKANGIILLDHHEGALEDFNKEDVPVIDFKDRYFSNHDTKHCDEDKLTIYFDQNRSGAVLAWNFCFPSVPTPALLSYIQDRDLWLFKDKDTEAFSIWLRSKSMYFQTWSDIANRLTKTESKKEILTEARAMKEFYDQKIQEIVKTHRWGYVLKYHVPICNAPYSFSSDVANALLKLYPNTPFAVSYIDEGLIRKWSLRSEDHRENVFEVAKKFGGGGHRNASGFTTPI